MAADYAASHYGNTPGTYDPQLAAVGRTTFDGQNAWIRYGPRAFEAPSLLQAVGFNESWKANLALSGGWQVAGNQLLNRVEIEMASEIATITNATRLDLTPMVVHYSIQRYNNWADFINAPHY